MFLYVSVCPEGGVPEQVHTPWDQVHPVGPGATPRTRYTPGTRYTSEQVPPGTLGTPRDQVHPPRGRLLLRTIRILLECILVHTNEIRSMSEAIFLNSTLLIFKGCYTLGNKYNRWLPDKIGKKFPNTHSSLRSIRVRCSRV